MSLRKRCSKTVPPSLPDGGANPFYCATTPRCDHHWHYDVRVNRKRYRGTTETADKGQAKNIEAKERSRILEGRHGIRRQPDITFKTFAEEYLRDYAEQHKRSATRDRDIIKILNRSFGAMVLHEITAHRILQWQRERLTGTWRAKGQTSPAKPVKPGTVNRELDTLRAMLGKAVEWRKLLASPAESVRRLKVENRRDRILTADEQDRLLGAAPRKARAIIALALLTGARIGEVLGLEWVNVSDDAITFLHTKNGKERRLPLSPSLRAILGELPKTGAHVFTNARTGERYTSNGVRHVFHRAVLRAGLVNPEQVTPHTLRHTALSRMIAGGCSDHTVMAISGHSSTRMLERYVHPSQALKVDALETGATMATTWAQLEGETDAQRKLRAELEGMSSKFGGRQEDRTPDLSVANAGGRKR